MCGACVTAATAAANRTAANSSARLAGHGRPQHGRDAGRSRHDAGRDVQAAWQNIYDQTYNRLHYGPTCTDVRP